MCHTGWHVPFHLCLPQENFELNHETLYLAVKLVDHYLVEVVSMRDKLQLIGSTAILIASKFEVTQLWPGQRTAGCWGHPGLAAEGNTSLWPAPWNTLCGWVNLAPDPFQTWLMGSSCQAQRGTHMEHAVQSHHSPHSAHVAKAMVQRLTVAARKAPVPE